MRMRGMLLALCLCLCLSGCGMDKRGARMEDLALLRVLAVDGDGGSVSVWTATGPVGDQAAAVLSASAPTVAGACRDAREKGSAYAVYSHVGEVLVGEELAKNGLTELLDYLERDTELRLSTRIWLVRGGADCGEEQAEDTVKRLTALEELTHGFDCTAGDAIAALDRSGTALIPALAWTETGELTPAGYGVLRDDRLVCWLEEDCARGAELLRNAVTEQVEELPGGGAVRLGGGSSGIRLSDDGTALQIELKLRSTAVTLPGGWSEETRRAMEGETAAWAEDCTAQCVAMLQTVGVDALELGRRAGLRRPWQWDDLAKAWPETFPALDVEVRCTASVEQ